jgi:dCTP diphosphatase
LWKQLRLLSIFSGLKEEESAALPSDKLAEVEQELADIQIYLIRLADKSGIDLMQAVASKIELNEKKYPARLRVAPRSILSTQNKR